MAYLSYVDTNGKNKRKKIFIIDGKERIKIGNKYVSKRTFLNKIKKGGNHDDDIQEIDATNETDVLNQINIFFKEFQSIKDDNYDELIRKLKEYSKSF